MNKLVSNINLIKDKRFIIFYNSLQLPTPPLKIRLNFIYKIQEFFVQIYFFLTLKILCSIIPTYH